MNAYTNEIGLQYETAEFFYYVVTNTFFAVNSQFVQFFVVLFSNRKIK